MTDPDKGSHSARLLEATATEPASRKKKPNVGDPSGDNLHDYWTRDPEGLAKWAELPHPWTALYTHLKKYIKNDNMAKATASKWYHDVKGHWPAEEHKFGKGDSGNKGRSSLLVWLADQRAGAFEEALHPRTPSGQFGSGSSSQTTGQQQPTKAKPQPAPKGKMGKGTKATGGAKKPWSKMSAHEKHVAHLAHLAHLKAQGKPGEKGKTPGALGKGTKAVGDKPSNGEAKKPPGPERAKQLKAELGQVVDQMKAARKKGDKKRLMELATQAAKLKNQLEGREGRPDIDIAGVRNMDMMGDHPEPDQDEVDPSWDDSDGDEELPDLQDVTLEDLIEAARILGMLLDQADDENTPDGAETAGRAMVSGDMPGLGEGGRFQALKAKLAAKGAKDPAALAAWIGRRKYGKKAFAKLASKAKASKQGRSADPRSLAQWLAARESRRSGNPA